MLTVNHTHRNTFQYYLTQDTTIPIKESAFEKVVRKIEGIFFQCAEDNTTLSQAIFPRTHCFGFRIQLNESMVGEFSPKKAVLLAGCDDIEILLANGCSFLC